MHTELNSLKTASKKVVHKAGEFLGTKIAEAVTKLNDDETEKQEPVEETIRKKRWNIIQIEKSIT